MINCSAYWQAATEEVIPQPQKVLKQPKKGAVKETAKETDGERSNAATALV